MIYGLRKLTILLGSLKSGTNWQAFLLCLIFVVRHFMLSRITPQLQSILLSSYIIFKPCLINLKVSFTVKKKCTLLVAHNSMPYYWVAFSYTSLTLGRKIPWNHMTTNTRKLSSGWYSLLNRNHDAPSMRSSTFFTAEVRYSCGFPFSRALFVKSRTSFFY